MLLRSLCTYTYGCFGRYAFLRGGGPLYVGVLVYFDGRIWLLCDPMLMYIYEYVCEYIVCTLMYRTVHFTIGLL